MAKPSTPQLGSLSISSDQPAYISGTKFFFTSCQNGNLPEACFKKGACSDLIRGLLKVNHIERGRVKCVFEVKKHVLNVYGTLHGGAVATFAELVSVACARTVVAEDKELFLGELSISYLSAAPLNVKLEVEGWIVRSGRSVTVTSVEFRIKETRKVVYTAHATFFKTPIAKL